MRAEGISLEKSKRLATAALTSLVIFAALLGCVRLHNYAILWGCKYSGSCPGYYLELSQVVGDWEFKAHALHFSRSLAVHRVLLPGRPSEVAIFDASQLKLTAMSADGTTAPTPLKSGSVMIDVPGERTVVDLTTSSSPFFGNGVYPLSTIGF